MAQRLDYISAIGMMSIDSHTLSCTVLHLNLTFYVRAEIGVVGCGGAGRAYRYIHILLIPNKSNTTLTLGYAGVGRSVGDAVEGGALTAVLKEA